MMQRIVDESEWKRQWQDGFRAGVSQNPKQIKKKLFDDVKLQLMSHLGHWGSSSYSKYSPVVEMILDQLDPANPEDGSSGQS
jgi:hypothetical protein